MAMSEPKIQDSALRAMTDDGAFRVVVVRTTDTVRRMLELQGHSGQEAQFLGELITGAVMVRETMAPDFRLQALLRSQDNRHRLVADTHPDGGSRGLITFAQSGNSARRVQGRFEMRGSSLEIVRTLYRGDVHRGVVEVPEGGGVSEALMTYLQSSEQVASMLAVACVLDDDNRVVASGGYLVQLLPEVGRGPLAIMAERLNDFRDIRELVTNTDAAPSPLLDEILYGMPFTRLHESELGWKCRCSAVRVMSSLATLSRSELAELIADGKAIELSCDFCSQTYNISPNQLAGLLEQS
jgi:molecular chaperone Hsp33